MLRSGRELLFLQIITVTVGLDILTPCRLDGLCQQVVHEYMFSSSLSMLTRSRSLLLSWRKQITETARPLPSAAGGWHHGHGLGVRCSAGEPWMRHLAFGGRLTACNPHVCLECIAYVPLPEYYIIYIYIYLFR